MIEDGFVTICRVTFPLELKKIVAYRQLKKKKRNTCRVDSGFYQRDESSNDWITILNIKF